MAGSTSHDILFHLVKLLEIKVTRTTILEELERHPEHNSMLAFSETLDRLNIPKTPYPNK